MFTIFLLILTLLTGRDLEKDKKFCHDCGNKESQSIPSINGGMPNEIQRECCKTKGRCSPWQKSCPGTAAALIAKKKRNREVVNWQVLKRLQQVPVLQTAAGWENTHKQYLLAWSMEPGILRQTA